MKIGTKLAFVGAVTALALAGHAVADDNVFLSPKAKSLQIKHMATTSTSESEPCCAHFTVAQNGSPKMQALQPKVAVASSKNDPDLVKQERQMVYTGRSPFRGRQMQQQQFEVAPLK